MKIVNHPGLSSLPRLWWDSYNLGPTEMQWGTLISARNDKHLAIRDKRRQKKLLISQTSKLVADEGRGLKVWKDPV
jgi:hypothetical protein